MIDSDFWRELADNFRELIVPRTFKEVTVSLDFLKAKWKRYETPAWSLVDTSLGGQPGYSSMTARFEPLARRGGTKLDMNRDSLEAWLDAMKAERIYIREEITSVETSELVSCSISDLCKQSGDFCNALESRAIEAERLAKIEEAARADPKNWSPLRRQFEAFKSLKTLINQEPERIPEELVRRTLGEQYGISPEDVTMKQIQFEVAGLLRDHPRIEVVPSQPQIDTPKLETKGEISKPIANREARLQAFVREERATIADVRRSAKVFKANMQEWRRGELADASAMSMRIEGVLSGKTPLVKRGKKKG